MIAFIYSKPVLGMTLKPLVTGDFMKQSKNKKYELKMKADGLRKITIWVPINSAPDFKAISQYCVENRDCTPFMVRCALTGQMRKGV